MAEIIRADGAIVAKYIGGIIKQVSENGFRGHGVRWHDPNRKDLQGEWFSAKTYFMRNAGYPVIGIPVNYQHGLHKNFGNLAIGIVNLVDEDEIGLLVEGEKKTREQYIEMLHEIGRKADMKFSDTQLSRKAELAVKAVDTLIAEVPLQFSGGFDPSTWLVDPETKHIDQAGMIHLAFTPTPADDLNPIVRFKSAIDEVLKYEPTTIYSLPYQQTDTPTGHKEPIGVKGDTGATDTEAAQPNAQTNVKKSPIKGQSKMDNEEQKADNPAEMLAGIAEQLMALAQSLGMSEGEAIAMADEVVEEAKAEGVDPEKDPEEAAEKMVKRLIKKHMDKVAKAQKFGNKAQSLVNDYLKAQPATQSLPAFSGGNGNGRKADITVSGDSRFQNWKPEDFLFAAMLDKQILSKGKAGIITDATKFYREFADRAERTGFTQHLPSSAIKALHTIKANELDHSTQTAYGDEWVPTSWDNNLWRKARIDTVVMPQFRVIDMPSNPFELPIEGTDSTMYYVAETTAEAQLTLAASDSPIPDSKIGSGKVQLSAKKFGTRVGFSAELEEDSIIPVLSIYREQAETAFNEGIDDVLLNGDTETGTTNINSDGSALAATSRYLAFGGLRKNTFTNSTNQVDASGAAPTLNHIRQLRFLLSRQVSTKLPGLRIFTNPEAYSGLLKMDEFLTMDKAGPNATAQSGQIGFIDNIPVFVSDQLPLVDADGKVTAAGNSVNRGSLLIAYSPHFYVGYRRRLAVNLDYIPYYDSYQLTLTARMDFVVRDTDSVALLYNIGI